MEIEKDYLDNVCLLGQGEKCCRYITAQPDGILCGKDTPAIKAALDKNVANMTAKGDNCEGWDSCQKTLES